jgi:hypothetical protein
MRFLSAAAQMRYFIVRLHCRLEPAGRVVR